MAECSEIEAGGEVRTIKDATARSGVAANAAAITAINTLITKMQTPYSITPQKTASVITGNFGCQRIGNVVILTATPEITITNQETLLASGFPKPASAIRFPCHLQNHEGQAINLILRANGELSLTANYPSGTPFTDWTVGCLTYLTTDPLPN